MSVKQAKYIQSIARFFSIIGHPLLTISLLVYFLSHYKLPSKEADKISLIIICGVAIPIVLHNIWKWRKGRYSNFDVSDRQQRQRFFPVVLVLLACVGIYMWYWKISAELSASIAVFWCMVVTFMIVNLKMKASLHAGINFYIVSILMFYTPRWGIIILLLAILVAVSRRLLQRHTWIEIIVGTCLGVLFGYINTCFLK